ncbi:stomatin-like protein [uncultured Desulfovibrio sp.]|uniref:SPFH domain-containing protein n=1 Tax=uncultured Desulfovibrio sp. TaxID=167968 RepID=UPI00261C377F|nr:stomatin-like protein [uncultured Desulfovibrio sp.]
MEILDPGFNPTWLVSAAIALFILVFLWRCVVIVPTQSAFIVERLGKFRGVLHAGFHVLVPFFDRIAYRRSLKEQVLDVPEQTCITRDNVSVSIDGVLFLQVLSPEKSAYGISDYEWGAIQLAQTTLRSAIGKLEMDKTFEERSRINQEVVEALDDATAAWGVKVLRYEIRDITPPASVMEAMEKQMRAEREKRAAIAQSEGDMQSRINLAEGAKAAAIAESEGLKQAMINKAEGEAAQIRTVAQATADGLDAVAQRLEAGGGVAAAQLRLAEAYVEKFGELAKAGTTTIIPANVGDVAGMVATLTQLLRPGEGLSKAPAPGTGAPRV